MSRLKVVKRTGGPNPRDVEKCGDGVVAGNSNELEIAGSLRNSFRANLGIENDGGRALFGPRVPSSGYRNSDKLRMPFIYIRESDCE